MVKVRIYVAGNFYVNWFRWRHPHCQAVLMLMNEPGRTATFYGYGRVQVDTDCQRNFCRGDAAVSTARPIPTYDPIGCDL